MIGGHEADDRTGPTLDYASRRTVGRRTVAAVPVRPATVLTVALGLWLAAVAAWAAGWRQVPTGSVTDLPNPLGPVGLAAIAVAVPAVVSLARTRRWAIVGGSIAAFVLTAATSGVVQIERCPHATYVQVFGATWPIAGTACHNRQPVDPWWHRGR